MVGVESCSHGERLGRDHNVHASHFDFTHGHAEDRPINAVAADRRCHNCHGHHDQRAMLLLHGVSLYGTAACVSVRITETAPKVIVPKLPPKSGAAAPRTAN